MIAEPSLQGSHCYCRYLSLHLSTAMEGYHVFLQGSGADSLTCLQWTNLKSAWKVAAPLPSCGSLPSRRPQTGCSPMQRQTNTPSIVQHEGCLCCRPVCSPDRRSNTVRHSQQPALLLPCCSRDVLMPESLSWSSPCAGHKQHSSWHELPCEQHVLCVAAWPVPGRLKEAY